MVNRMGFNNDGAEAWSRDGSRRAAAAGTATAVVGVNIGKTKVVPEAEAVADYVKSTAPARAVRRLPGGQRLLARTPRACATSRPSDRLRPLLDRRTRQAADRP